MCGRYFLADSGNSGELRGIIDQLNRRGATVKTGEIFPTDTVPVLANNRNRRVMPFPMQWGYTLPDGRLLINARSETAGEKPLFQDAMRQHRCLIPAMNYFEWEKRGREKIKYAIRQADAGLLYMAGLYRVENGRAVFTILTRTDSLHPRPDACHSNKQCKAGLAESGLRCSANFGAGV